MSDSAHHEQHAVGAVAATGRSTRRRPMPGGESATDAGSPQLLPVRRRLLRGAAGLVAAAAVCSGLVTGASAAAGTRAAAPAGGAASGGTWGTAQEVPGIAALNQGGAASVNSVSCASAGNCSAGGNYAPSPDASQGFVVGETNGTWGTAVEVPGLAALNSDAQGGISSVSCASAGYCSAGGAYRGSGSLRTQAFVVTEAKGAWRTAMEVPGIGVLNTGGAGITSVSCPSAGNCGGGGVYQDARFDSQVFVVTQTSGTWGKAQAVPGLVALNTGRYAVLGSVSCASAGNCSAGGYYTDSSGYQQAFVVGEVNGAWGTAQQVPGTATLAKFGAAVTSVSCASAGNCSAGGQYRASPQGFTQVFVVSKTNGTRGTAKEVPGSSTLNQGGIAQINSVSCASAGNCGAGGYYTDGGGTNQAFVVDETNGTWGTALQVPGTVFTAQISSVSCASAGNCSAGGQYGLSPAQQAFVVDETSGPLRVR